LWGLVPISSSSGMGYRFEGKESGGNDLESVQLGGGQERKWPNDQGGPVDATDV